GVATVPTNWRDATAASLFWFPSSNQGRDRWPLRKNPGLSMRAWAARKSRPGKGPAWSGLQIRFDPTDGGRARTSCIRKVGLLQPPGKFLRLEHRQQTE